MVKKIRKWNYEHPLVLKYGNLKTPEGKYIFSCEEAEEIYPGSTILEKYEILKWDEYTKRGFPKAESFYPGEYAILK